ncbi:hypothetical protein [Allofrancisella frigidaquae]|uniref:Uncharacterized protein n=1 Tax=Allofrancisella frigidaquae TaxID=1085644 RepID=A0A6M3HUM5_9GAMM|nr:hypothetical protein [Allofrancisella frigidaquae]QIV94955.1 hypothetical protein E3E15_06190 [Allofrancisella frigidaquae]
MKKVLYLFFRGTGDPNSVIKVRKEYCRNNPEAKEMPKDCGVPIYDSWHNESQLNVDLSPMVVINSIDIPGAATTGTSLKKIYDGLFCNIEEEASNVFEAFSFPKSGTAHYNYQNYDYVITAGFSRGAIVAMYCATMLSKRGIKASCIMMDPVPGNAKDHYFSEVKKANDFFKTGKVDFVVSLLNREAAYPLPKSFLKEPVAYAINSCLNPFYKRVCFELPSTTIYDQAITIDIRHSCKHSEIIARHYFLYIVVKYALGQNFDTKKYKKYFVPNLTVNDCLVEGFNLNKTPQPGFFNYICTQQPRHIRNLKSGKYMENIPPYLARFSPEIYEEGHYNPINKNRSATPTFKYEEYHYNPINKDRSATPTFASSRSPLNTWDSRLDYSNELRKKALQDKNTYDCEQILMDENVCFDRSTKKMSFQQFMVNSQVEVKPRETGNKISKRQVNQSIIKPKAAVFQDKKPSVATPRSMTPWES